MSTPRDRFDVVVIDDVCRFACHVFQYLAKTIGFGIGRVPDDGSGEVPAFKPGVPLETPAGDAAVWWVNAGALESEWRGQLTRVIDLVRGKESRFLVDVRGPLRSDWNGYRVDEVVNLLLTTRKSNEIVPVSAYRTGNLRIGSEEWRIRAKTWEVLQEIVAQLPAQEAELAETGAHILITGAGFELASRIGGCKGTGMPFTSEILREGWNRDADGACILESGASFPIPRKLADGGGDHAAFRDAARAGDLDAYWNEALKLILERAARAHGNEEPRKQKSIASQQEHRTRENFRHSFLRYDWGQLGQALDAASLGWAAWLSTNYTGFADRALAQTERDRARSDENDHKPWRIVSTSHEAVHLTRRLLHGNPPDGRILFKLHGHIEHLLTMAIAGQDKEIYSTLSLPVDSLHEVYSAAELYLERTLEKTTLPVFWHIVGHGMKDALLADLLLGVAGHTPALEHNFIFVSPDAPDREREQRARFSAPNRSVVSVRCRADQYLARLRRWGMTEADSKDLRGWAELMAGEQRAYSPSR